MRFFDSDLLSSPGQWRAVAIGIMAVLLPLGLIYVPGFYKKYLLLARLPAPRPYQLAMLGDILGLILLAMTLIGIFTTIQWHSLFPGLRDYHILASYPVRMRDVFVAKFTALLAFALILILSTTLLPSVLLPGVLQSTPAMRTRRSRLFSYRRRSPPSSCSSAWLLCRALC